MKSEAEPNRPDTGKLDADTADFQDLSILEPQVTYQPAPQPDLTADQPGDKPVWRVRFELASDPSRCFGLDINGEVTLGRNIDEPGLIDLTSFGAAEAGVSRRHVMLRPTPTVLYVIDLGSTNGTLRNGHSIGVNTPYPISHGDTLTLGKLQFVVRVIKRPVAQTAPLERRMELSDALQQIARAITSQLDLNEVLNQVAETAMTLTSAGETGIWLVDEQSGELFLVASHGIEEEGIRHIRLPVRDDTLAGKVIKTGKPLRASRKAGEERIKVKTGYLVEALVYVPIALGGVTFGVLAAAHRDVGKRFRERDERLLMAIAEFAAIAIQNARLYGATDRALARRVKELAALNELSHAVSSSLELARVYEVLVQQMSRYWPVEAIRLYLVDASGSTLRAYTGPDGKDGIPPCPIGKGIVGSVAQRGTPVLSNEVSTHADYDPEVDRIGDAAPQSLACVPLRIQDRVVGVLALFNRADGPFTEDDLSRLEAFANPVATAIENARLFAESQQRHATIQATAQVLSQPLLILDENGNLLISNRAAAEIVEQHMSELFDGLSSSVGRTVELQIGDHVYLTTAEHSANVGTIIVMQDITYVKQLEQERLAFMEALSHDLKNPLTSIRGWAQLVQKTLPDDERIVRYAGQIISSADRMLGMIRRLLESAEYETFQITPKPCDLEAVVRRTFSHVEGTAAAKGIGIDFEQTGTPYRIMADESRMEQVALNLLDNALKFSPDHTHIHVRLEYSAEGITLRVQDEGPGIPPEDLPNLFKKYYRGKGVADVTAGTGVGLAVVRATVLAHGGQVTAHNLPEKGAEFVVTLPAVLRVEEKPEQ